MGRFSIFTIYNWVQKPFRKKRLALYQEVIRPTPQTTILDVGGSPWFWTGAGIRGGGRQITVLNTDALSDAVKAEYSDFKCIEGDGCDLKFSAASFDVAFSNSVIEHVGTFEKQKAFAAEIRRVGKVIWVQTPAREFPVEPHFMAPFIHYYPRWLQRMTARWFTLWGLTTKPTSAQVENMLDEIRLLNFREMVELFPDCEIRREKFFGLTKSYIAIRR